MKIQEKLDISSHVVEMNKLINELNRFTRNAAKVDVEEVSLIALKVEHLSREIHKLCEEMS